MGEDIQTGIYPVMVCHKNFPEWMFGGRPRLLLETLADTSHAAQESFDGQVLSVIYQDLMADYSDTEQSLRIGSLNAL